MTNMLTNLGSLRELVRAVWDVARRGEPVSRATATALADELERVVEHFPGFDDRLLARGVVGAARRSEQPRTEDLSRLIDALDQIRHATKSGSETPEPIAAPATPARTATAAGSSNRGHHDDVGGTDIQRWLSKLEESTSRDGWREFDHKVRFSIAFFRSIADSHIYAPEYSRLLTDAVQSDAFSRLAGLLSEAMPDVDDGYQAPARAPLTVPELDREIGRLTTFLYRSASQLDPAFRESTRAVETAMKVRREIANLLAASVDARRPFVEAALLYLLSGMLEISSGALHQLLGNTNHLPFHFGMIFQSADAVWHTISLSAGPSQTVATPALAGSRPKSTHVDVGIITIREDELRAVLGVFPDSPRLHRERRHYNIRLAAGGPHGSYRIAVLRQMEQGNGEALDAARDLLEDLKPRLLLVVGIAGGVPHPDFTLGDVVVSTRILDYCVQAHKENEQPTYALAGGPIDRSVAAGVSNLPARTDALDGWTDNLPVRPSVQWPDAELYGPDDWKSRVRSSLERHFGGTPRARAIHRDGPIASSDTLVKDTSILIPWLQTARGILAVEMESGGVYRAARDRIPMLAIRGISDIVGLNRREEWTDYACQSAAAFARAYLRTTPIDIEPPS